MLIKSNNLFFDIVFGCRRLLFLQDRVCVRLQWCIQGILRSIIRKPIHFNDSHFFLDIELSSAQDCTVLLKLTISSFNNEKKEKQNIGRQTVKSVAEHACK